MRRCLNPKENEMLFDVLMLFAGAIIGAAGWQFYTARKATKAQDAAQKDATP
jgi:hypothetical protein